MYFISYFYTYIDGIAILSIHYRSLQCKDLSTFVNRSEKCLNKVILKIRQELFFKYL